MMLLIIPGLQYPGRDTAASPEESDRAKQRMNLFDYVPNRNTEVLMAFHIHMAAAPS